MAPDARPPNGLPLFAPSGGAAADVPLWQDRALSYRLAKRLLDLGIALPALVLSLPLLGLIAVAVRIDSPGPALFRQERLGLGAEPFGFLKFRTLLVDAAERFPDLYDYDRIAAAGGHVPLKTVDDPRVTRAGRWLRRSSLDELPNLLHVVSGRMSLVGPRPEIRGLLGCYGPEHLMNFRVKPGVTGLPQISGRDALTVAETIALDLQYARSASFRLDLSILAKTVHRVFTGRDAF